MPRFSPVDWKTLERVFIAAGFQFVRQEGSHRSLFSARHRPPGCDSGLSRNSSFRDRNNLKTAGISRDEYFKLLEQCR
jgi:hypothetical protein